MIFGANKKKKRIEKQLISYPNLITITSTCIRISMELYVNSLREEIQQAGENCGIEWSDDKLSEVTSILFNICNFTVPSLIHQSFKDKKNANLYVNGWMQLETDKNSTETYEYFQNILNEYKINIMGLFPVVVGMENNQHIEILMKDPNISAISARAVSFTNDLVLAFCTKNPVLEGFTGDYAVQMALN